MTEHGDEGAMGVVFNRPADATVADTVPELSDVAAGEDPIYIGGPVQTEAVVVLAEFRDPGAAATMVVGDVGLVSAKVDTDELPAATRQARASPATRAGARVSSRMSSRRRRGSSRHRSPASSSTTMPRRSGAPSSRAWAAATRCSP